MSLMKGTIGLTRYQVLDAPGDLSVDGIIERLRPNAFMDIENSAEEESLGWVDILDTFSTEFEPANLKYGDAIAFGLRYDTRKVSAKTVNRYLTVSLTEAENRSGGPLSAEQRRLLKSRVRQDLLMRTPLSTDVYEICWLTRNDEVWLAAIGTKTRERFEDIWRRTFEPGLLMKIPYVSARTLLPGEVSPEALDQAKASALLGGGGD